MSLRIAAVYVVLVAAAFAVVGFGLRSAGSGSAPPIQFPRVQVPPTSPAPTPTAGLHSTSSSPGTTAPAAAPSATVPVSSVTVSPVAAPSDTNTAQSGVAVNYFVVSQDDGQFEGEVTVVNNGSTPISGWQIVLALPGDQITSFSNASGDVSDDILLLQPQSDGEVVAAGGTLSVSFTATGGYTTPELCTFDSVVCG